MYKFAPVGWYFRGKKRQAQAGKASRINKRSIGFAIRQQRLALVVALETRKQNHQIIEQRLRQFLAVSDAFRHRPLKVIEGARILSQLKLADSKQRPPWTGVAAKRHELPQRILRVRVMLLFI